MISYLSYDDLLIVNDLEDLGMGRYVATDNDPYLELKNLPDGWIQDISVELKSENGNLIEIYWAYAENESYSPGLLSSQTLKSGILGTYKFLVDSKKEIKKLRLDPTNASGIIEIKKIEIYYILKEENLKSKTDIHSHDLGEKSSDIMDNGNKLNKSKIDINQMNQDYDLLLNYGLFDVNWYIQKYGSTDLARKDPISHYLKFGANEGYNPCPNFDTNWYLKLNPDVTRFNLNPLVHFIRFGAVECRDPHPLFSMSKYLQENPDVAAARMNPLLHYIKYGIKEGRRSYPVDNNVEIIRYLKDLKLSLKGKEGYLFLVNDFNNEIRQHFDQSYTSNFKADVFFRNFNLKKEYCSDKHIEYFFFIVPDKSLICKDFLPFDIKRVKRNYDLIADLAIDFAENLDHTCYFNNDSHINYLGGKELVCSYLNHINTNFKRENFNKLIEEQLSIVNLKYNGDLTSERNFSYSPEEKKEYLNEEITTFKNENLINLNKFIPEKFKFMGTRETEYYKNTQGLTNLKVLILRDSSLNYLKDVLSVYFEEMLLYWDHWHFNKELIEWYKPDIILEIRTERFLENMVEKIG